MMRKSLFLSTISLVFAVLATAQISDDEFKTLMQSNGANVAAIRDAADNAAAAPAAKKLEETFTKVAAYWKAKNVPDAVTFAESARDAAKAIADGQGDKAANLMKLQQQCGGCHMAHRGGGRGNFTFK
jgi:mono/diheme cytochrome c family protein